MTESISTQRENRANELFELGLSMGQYKPNERDKILKDIELVSEVNCMELCEILRLKLTGYVDTLNLHIMKDGSGSLTGCMCR